MQPRYYSYTSNHRCRVIDQHHKHTHSVHTNDVESRGSFDGGFAGGLRWVASGPLVVLEIGGERRHHLMIGRGTIDEVGLLPSNIARSQGRRLFFRRSHRRGGGGGGKKGGGCGRCGGGLWRFLLNLGFDGSEDTRWRESGGASERERVIASHVGDRGEGSRSKRVFL